ncbi:MAG TPA: homocysteine S-methyltransferase [Candidatus Aminicenantes bacterium]|nr:homocysteine S-methyltransferase [Candidatus Aminicenantes bacterium]
MTTGSADKRERGIPDEYPLVIDGGLSNQLENQGNNLDDPLWTAALLSSHPEEIRKAHLTYLRAGARVLVTAGYQATLQGFRALGHDARAARQLLFSTVDLAREAIAEFSADLQSDFFPRVAAGIGPYGAFLADGSEYTGNYGISEGELIDFHLPRLQLLDKSSADFLAVETLPDFTEAKVLARLLQNTKKSGWVSFTCRDGAHLRDGTALEESLRLFARHSRVFALGINCTAPRYISELIRRIREATPEKRVVVYPNSGEVYNAAGGTWSDTADLDNLERMVEEWLDLGADMIGGCCRLGPDAVRTIDGVIRSRSRRKDR